MDWMAEGAEGVLLEFRIASDIDGGLLSGSSHSTDALHLDKKVSIPRFNNASEAMPTESLSFWAISRTTDLMSSVVKISHLFRSVDANRSRNCLARLVAPMSDLTLALIDPVLSDGTVSIFVTRPQ